MSRPMVGAQIFTVRDHIKTMPGVVESFGKLARIGYKAVQVSGIGPVAHADVVAAAEDAGLSIVATHIAWGACLEKIDQVVEQHKLWKCRHVAIGGLPGEYAGLSGLQRFLDELGPVCARLADEGMDFSYHNHNHELVRYGESTWLEMLYDRSAPDVLKAELDVYWLQAGGADPTVWIKRLSGRQPLLHLKDMAITPERAQRFAEIGEGNLNWPSILQAAEEAGVEYMLVEQDLCYERDPFESLAISYRNLKAMGYE